jgi:hypothetical protein
LRALRGARLRFGAVVVSVACAVTASPARAASVYTVTDTADGTGPCLGTACPSLRAALAATQSDPGSTIELGAGTYTLGDGLNQPVDTGELETGADVTITGAGQNSTVIEQTDGQNRVIADWNAAATLTMNDLTLTGGHLGPGPFEDGGAILSNGPLALHDVTVSGNTAVGSTPSNQVSGCCEAIGGVATLQTLVLDHSSVVDNVATGGDGTSVTSGPAGEGGEAIGGILATQGEPITITDSTISGNIANSGNGGTSTSGVGGQGGLAYGGIFSIDTAPISITDSTVADNVANAGTGGQGASGGAGGGAYGAGIFAPDATLDISSSTFNGNVLHAGAGGPGTIAPGAGGTAEGAGVAGGSRSGGNWIRNSTVTANAAVAGAGGSGPLGTGVAGYALGGGVAEDTTQSMTVTDSTFADNRASGTSLSYGGNLYDNPTPMTIAGTIFVGGAAQNGPNCAFSPVPDVSDGGNNLESTSPSQCGFSATAGDVIGADPLLLALADDGGPTQTMALGAGSPAIGAGGTCLDFSQPGSPPLTVDQRGRPRKSPCDIGAFETQTPSIGGPGDGDKGSRGGSSSSAPSISHLRQSHARWTEGSAAAKLASASATVPRSGKIPTGTTFSFSLNTAAPLHVRFVRLLAGRRLKRSCVTRHPGHHTDCRHRVASSFLTFPTARSGPNTLRFTGRLSGSRRLKPGDYVAMFTANNSAGHSKAVSLRFAIIKR